MVRIIHHDAGWEDRLWDIRFTRDGPWHRAKDAYNVMLNRMVREDGHYFWHFYPGTHQRKYQAFKSVMHGTNSWWVELRHFNNNPAYGNIYARAVLKAAFDCTFSGQLVRFTSVDDRNHTIDFSFDAVQDMTWKQICPWLTEEVLALEKIFPNGSCELRVSYNNVPVNMRKKIKTTISDSLIAEFKDSKPSTPRPKRARTR